MNFPVTYDIDNGEIKVTATKEGPEYVFDLTFPDGRTTRFGYREKESNKIAMFKPVTERYEYNAMVALWQMQVSRA